MLRLGGSETTVFGFHRTRGADADIAGAVIDLGRTADARFLQRIWAVVLTIPRLRHWADTLASSDVILARNLEMLFLAAVARALYAPHAALVYECLDIHRLLLSNGVMGAALRQLERSLLKRCRGLMVSSPAFVREYFQKTNRTLPKVFIVENKIFLTASEVAKEQQSIPTGPPWRIGWFGLLRCRRSLDVLVHALRTIPDLTEVIVAGKPTLDVFAQGDREFQGIPGLTFLGPYKDEAADLERLFGSVHFIWAIDFYEAETNSAWLLPNRLYRAALYGAVPLAMARSETGRWLEAHRTGILLEEPPHKALVDTIRGMTPARLASAKAALKEIPRAALVAETAECQALVRDLGQLNP